MEPVAGSSGCYSSVLCARAAREILGIQISEINPFDLVSGVILSSFWYRCYSDVRVQYSTGKSDYRYCR